MSVFGGSTYNYERDYNRLKKQLDATWWHFRDGNWWTLDHLASRVSLALGKAVTTQSISARLRDFRKPHFGGYTVERRNVGGGLWEYRLIKSTQPNNYE